MLLQETKLSQDTFQKIMAKSSRWSSIHSPNIDASGGLVVLWNPLTIQGHLIQQHKLENFTGVRF